MRLLAVLADAGLGLAYLESRWPDDRAVLEALGLEIETMHERRSKDLAQLIANGVAKALGG